MVLLKNWKRTDWQTRDAGASKNWLFVKECPYPSTHPPECKQIWFIWHLSYIFFTWVEIVFWLAKRTQQRRVQLERKPRILKRRITCMALLLPFLLYKVKTLVSNKSTAELNPTWWWSENQGKGADLNNSKTCTFRMDCNMFKSHEGT